MADLNNRFMRDFLSHIKDLMESKVQISVIGFAQTSSDLVNFIVSDIGNILNGKGGKVQLLAFKNDFVCTRGPLAGLSFLKKYRIGGDDMKKFRIPSPHHYKNTLVEELTEEELEQLIDAEEEAIKNITKLFKGKTVGGIIMEIIPGASGVAFYRKEFLMKLRALCDEKGKFLIADEALTCLRTGKLFAFEHYQGFLPDLVITGKAMSLCCVIAIGERAKQFPSQEYLSRNTVPFEPSLLIRASQIMKRIKSDNLFERSRRTGEEFLKYFRKLDEKNGFTGAHSSRGLGSLLYSENDQFVPFKGAYYRYCPPISMTVKMFHHICTRPDRYEPDHCSFCNIGGLLLICDNVGSCLTVAHPECVGLTQETMPKEEEEWYCPKCKEELN
jgi:hypothetical protein